MIVFSRVSFLTGRKRRLVMEILCGVAILLYGDGSRLRTKLVLRFADTSRDGRAVSELPAKVRSFHLLLEPLRFRE